MEKPPKEHIGMESPLETLEWEIKKLAEKAAEIEEDLTKARKAGDKEAAAKLKEEHERRMAEQREKLKKRAHLQSLALKE